MRYKMMAAVGTLLTLLMPLAQSAQASTKSDCQNDPSISITVCITQYYDQITNASRTYTSVSRYEFSWTRSDPQVGMTNAKGHAGVIGLPMNGGLINQVEDYDIGSPASGQIYTRVPAWHDQYVETDCHFHCHQCASQEVHLTRQTRSWDFSFNICTGTL
jgi:hypothetical protein